MSEDLKSLHTFHAVVWLNRAEAHVLQFDHAFNGAHKCRIEAHPDGTPPSAGDSSFFPRLYAAIEGSHEILLAGLGTARDDFAAWLAVRHPIAASRIVDSIHSDRPGDSQSIALARKYFAPWQRRAGGSA